MGGRIAGIYTAMAEGLPVTRRERVRAFPGIGLDGDRYANGTGFWCKDHRVSRDLTLFEAEVGDSVSAQISSTIDYGVFRRNLITTGVRLNDLVGLRFQIGSIVAEGTSLCEPCEYLQRIVGLSILRPLVHRGGLRANILTLGEICQGDSISLNAPEIGVGVVVRRAGHYLLGLRRNKSGSGTWSTPGGSVRAAESVLGCAARELREETGLVAERARVVSQTFNRLEDGCDWTSVFVAVDVPGDAEPRLREADKCSAWRWFRPNALPSPLFAPVASLF